MWRRHIPMSYGILTQVKTGTVYPRPGRCHRKEKRKSRAMIL